MSYIQRILQVNFRKAKVHQRNYWFLYVDVIPVVSVTYTKSIWPIILFNSSSQKRQKSVVYYFSLTLQKSHVIVSVLKMKHQSSSLLMKFLYRASKALSTN